jgi:hypothetical protein
MALLALGAFLACAACSSNPDVPDAGDAGIALPSNPLAPIDACQQLAKAETDLEHRCSRMKIGDSARVPTSLCPGQRLAPDQAAFLANQLAYDANAVSCVVSFRTNQACNSFPASDTGCPALGWGILGAGAVCASDLGCGPGLYCKRITPSSGCGVCTAVAALSDPCGPLAYNAPCGSGSCDGSECVPVVGVGQQCFPQANVCSAGLVCPSGQCVSPGGIGVICLFDNDCADGLFCDPASGKCAARAQAGGDCATATCPFGFLCGFTAPIGDGGVDGGPALCIPLNGAGGGCVFDNDGGWCLEAESCQLDAGKCAPIPGLSDPCDGSCLVGACQTGSCALVAAGGDCVQNIDCVSSVCAKSLSGTTCASLCALADGG